MPPTSAYTVLAPIRHGNLTVFPVVAARSFDTEEFLTLDEGLRSGEVIVTESGSVQPLMRRRRTPTPPGPQVNQLVLVNNSKRPLILLAGEIVTGGKQDRVIGKDRIIPARERSHRSWRLLRRTRALDRQQRQIWRGRNGGRLGASADGGPKCPRQGDGR